MSTSNTQGKVVTTKANNKNLRQIKGIVKSTSAKPVVKSTTPQKPTLVKGKKVQLSTNNTNLAKAQVSNNSRVAAKAKFLASKSKVPKSASKATAKPRRGCTKCGEKRKQAPKPVVKKYTNPRLAHNNLESRYRNSNMASRYDMIRSRQGGLNHFKDDKLRVTTHNPVKTSNPLLNKTGTWNRPQFDHNKPAFNRWNRYQNNDAQQFSHQWYQNNPLLNRKFNHLKSKNKK